MKKTVLFIVLYLFAYASLYAIKPSSSYLNTPSMMNLTYEEIKLATKDGALLNVWHLPSETIKTPVVIALPDAGNMGDWLYLGLYLQAYGLDVWMFDYRGFGGSSSFEMEREMLFYPEFIIDLSTVCDYVFEQRKTAPALLGLSMGTIILNEYVKTSALPIQTLIFDGYVNSPQEWAERLAETGKTIKLPENYLYTSNRYKQYCLFIVEEKDILFSLADINRPNSRKKVIKSYDCNHIMAFATFPKEYAELVQDFIYSHEL